MPEFRIRQNGVTVAQASGKRAEDEIFMYAIQFREDGELTIQVKHKLPSGPSWKRHWLMAQYPQNTINH